MNTTHQCGWCHCCRFVVKRSGSCSEWNWDNCRVSLLCLAPYQWHLQSGAKSFIQKSRSTRKQFQSLWQSTLQPAGCFQKQLKMAQFNSDVEFYLILSEVEQCYSLKNQLRKKANGIDVDAIKKQIKEEVF